MTFGWSVNSGTAFTIPNTFTTRREQLQAGEPGVLVCLIHRHVPANLSGRQGAVGFEWTHASQEDQIARAHNRDVVGDRGHRFRQLDAAHSKPLLRRASGSRLGTGSKDCGHGGRRCERDCEGRSTGETPHGVYLRADCRHSQAVAQGSDAQVCISSIEGRATARAAASCWFMPRHRATSWRSAGGTKRDLKIENLNNVLGLFGSCHVATMPT